MPPSPPDLSPLISNCFISLSSNSVHSESITLITGTLYLLGLLITGVLLQPAVVGWEETMGGRDNCVTFVRFLDDLYPWLTLDTSTLLRSVVHDCAWLDGIEKTGTEYEWQHWSLQGLQHRLFHHP